MEKIKKKGYQLAEAAGIKPQSISGYKNNGSLPKAEVLAAWAKEFDLNINWLLTGEGEMLQSEKPAPAPQPGLEREVAAMHREIELLTDQNRVLKEHCQSLKDMIEQQREQYRFLKDSIASAHPYAKNAPDPTEAFREELSPYGQEALQEPRGKYIRRKK